MEYTATADRAAAVVIKSYSNSFSLATKVLKEPVRTHIRNLYALVRIADELVDGVGAEYGLDNSQVCSRLDRYENAVYRAIATGFSTDLIIHAFATTARTCGIDRAHVQAFFQSMRLDTCVTDHDAESVSDYVHGSAEVIGHMCNAIFANDAAAKGQPWDQQHRDRAHEGASALGRAFQKVNFLRDFATDFHLLGRNYVTGDGVLPKKEGDNATVMTAADKAHYVADIRADLLLAQAAIPVLPRSARAGVMAAHDLYLELTDRLDQATMEQIATQRISVSVDKKAAITTRAVLRTLAQMAAERRS